MDLYIRDSSGTLVFSATAAGDETFANVALSAGQYELTVVAYEGDADVDGYTLALSPLPFGRGAIARLFAEVALVLCVQDARAQGIAVLVAGDRVKPRQKLGVFAQAVSVPCRGEPGVLKQVLGRMARSGQSMEKSPDGLTVPRIHLVERARVAPAQS